MPENDRRARPPLSGEPQPAAEPTAEPRRRPTPARPRRRWLRRLAGGLAGLMLVGAVGGGVATYGVYRAATAEMPDYQWLADYQPPQMSRIYAADSRLMAELATERRVFVPIAAIPKLRAAGLHLGRGPELLAPWRRRPAGHGPRRL